MVGCRVSLVLNLSCLCVLPVHKIIWKLLRNNFHNHVSKLSGTPEVLGSIVEVYIAMGVIDLKAHNEWNRKNSNIHGRPIMTYVTRINMSSCM